jgi:hypothetical protein
VVAKIEDADSLRCLDDIIRVSDGVMVARGDLGAQMPLEQVPSVQEAIVDACRKLNKPVIVASQLLESMIEYPTPTRAEVSLSCRPFGLSNHQPCSILLANQPLPFFQQLHLWSRDKFVLTSTYRALILSITGGRCIECCEAKS